MRVTIGKVGFDLDPSARNLFHKPGETLTGKELIDRHLYVWNCASKKGQLVQKVDTKGYMTLRTFAAFAEPRAHILRDEINARQTLEMKIKVLQAVKMNGMPELLRAVGAAMGVHKFRIDLSTFDWLKPLASFVVWMKIEYHYVELINTTKKLRLMIGLPHSVSLRAEILTMCDVEGLKTEVKAGKVPEVADMGITGKGTKKARAIRRAILRKKLKDLQMQEWSSGSGGFGGWESYGHGFGKAEPRPETKEEKQRKKIEAELEELEGMEGG